MKLLAIEVQIHFKANAGGAVELGNDDTFRTVDGERAAVGHEGQFAHVNALFLGAGLVLQRKGDVERCGVGFAISLGLVGAQLWLADFVVGKIEHDLIVVTLDREHFLEHGLESNDRAFVRGRFLL